MSKQTADNSQSAPLPPQLLLLDPALVEPDDQVNVRPYTSSFGSPTEADQAELQRLIASIGQWDRDHGAIPEAVYVYYERWLESLERMVTERGLVTEDEIRTRAEALHGADHH